MSTSDIKSKIDINPRIDIAFKKIFGVEENKDLLISLINSVVSDEDQVSEVTILNPYNPKNFKKDKLSILDIKAKGQDGKRFNIEIQISDEQDYNKRALYYWAKLYSEQLASTEDYGNLNKAIGIHILNFTSIPKVKKYHNVFRIKEKDSNMEYFHDLELHTIELRKFMQEAGDEISTVMSKIKDKVDLWAAFLTKYDLMNEESSLSGSLDRPELKKALNVLHVMSFTPDEREEYDAHLKWLRTEAAAIKKASSDAREEGLTEGLIKGKAEGMEKGKAVEKLEIAQKSLYAGLQIDLIAKLTGLSEEEIKKLQKK